MMARLVLVDSTRIVIKNVLELISISAPEKM
jgi:arginyl-tRNA synthetase